MSKKEEYILELENITKIFPGVKALDDVSFKIKKGEVHALVGENGAGKSTLINIISGVFGPTQGSIKVDGKEEKITNPSKAFELGIGVVHQERNLIDTFDIAENICFMDISTGKNKMKDKKAMNQKAERAMERVGLDLKPWQGIEELTSGKKQMLEIARAMCMDSKVLLLDEPTASISLTEADMLLKTVKQLKEEGVSIIYISHKLEEIFEIADSITVIRDGKNIGETLSASSLNKDKLIELMVGRKFVTETYNNRDLSKEPVILEAKDISSKKNPIPKSFQLKKGEILGWYGLVGAGRTEYAREIIGIDPITNGSLLIKGSEVSIKSYEEAFQRYKLCYISENRKEEGLFLQHNITDNVGIIALDQICTKGGFISYRKQNEITESYKESLSIKAKDIFVETASLSGGNQQKICIAKGLCVNPEIMIIDEPTVGIDVNTKGEIHKLIYELSVQGISVIVISSDMGELVGIADRIIVFRDNEIKGELENSKDYESMSTKVMGSILL
ncbi:sugar ABC transporter ATP-binding protein [Lachnotalea glycerini]|uniref:Sugar ABC transporter ATP-binding protein n=1 Tax=Lachnotalea glycerini TaxID=1763509 RepID=A0A371JFM0_9FIRM|nr:sugar ABC transporter ATP-binding protein [Lachnotalea glycerini]RDY31554.1 sugar ABC transporter ATP-binding protein [Lachnotalea glycerini]